MSETIKMIVKKVLSEAMDAPHFFDYSDAQRLNWMIGRAYELGKATSGRNVGRKASARKPTGAFLELVVQLRRKQAASGRRK